MQKPDIPENEKERLKEVYKYKLTEELSDESLEGIVEIASQICNMPISLITIVGDESQFFKAKQGIDGQGSPRDVSFCGHAINKPDELMIVPDATKDERFKDNPFVLKDPHIKFYAGIPILSPDKFPLGTLCVIDHKPNVLSDEQQRALRHLGKQVTLILELQKKNELLKTSEEKLKAQTEDLEDYTHLISHDLKEPVRNVKSFLDNLAEKHIAELSEKGKIYLNFARDGAIRMNQLIDDLLDFSKTARISGSKKPIDLNDVINNVLENIDFQKAESKAEINIKNNLPVIQGIESGLVQLFYNLIHNSLKFVPKGKSPVIEISSETTDSEYIIKIKDNGVGIPESQVENIFNIFRRVPSDENFSGTGVGLAIVKKVVSIHNAKIKVESEVGIGSEFIISFPK